MNLSSFSNQVHELFIAMNFSNQLQPVQHCIQCGQVFLKGKKYAAVINTSTFIPNERDILS